MALEHIYLDNNATTPLSPEVLSLYSSELIKFANASSIHTDGRNARLNIEKARKQVASLVNVNQNEIIFTSGGSESNNTVFNSMLNINDNRKIIVTSQIEHPSVLESAKYLTQHGFEIIYLPVDEYGTIKIDDYKKALQKKPLLVSIMAANNEIGTIQDIKTLCKMAHNANAFFHTDIVQAIGKIDINLKDWDVDYASFSAHKIYGPKGIGSLFVKNGIPIFPLIKGGHQENGLRAGTYNTPAIIAYGLASELAQNDIIIYNTKIKALRQKLLDGLFQKIPFIKLNGHQQNVLPNTLNVSFEHVEGESVLLMLDLAGIEVSTGSACTSANKKSSHVLIATGLNEKLARGSIRFSFGKYNTDKDVDCVLKILPPIISKLQEISSF